MTAKNESVHQSKSPKKSYSSPKLSHFGTIKELTSGGTGQKAEGKMGTNTSRHT